MKQTKTEQTDHPRHQGSFQQSDAYQIRTSLDINIGVPAEFSSHDYRADYPGPGRITSPRR